MSSRARLASAGAVAPTTAITDDQLLCPISGSLALATNCAVAHQSGAPSLSRSCKSRAPALDVRTNAMTPLPHFSATSSHGTKLSSPIYGFTVAASA